MENFSAPATQQHSKLFRYNANGFHTKSSSQLHFNVGTKKHGLLSNIMHSYVEKEQKRAKN